MGRAVLRTIYGILPNLDLLNTRAASTQSLFAGAMPITAAYTIESLGYALVYTVVIFFAALLVFRQRDL